METYLCWKILLALCLKLPLRSEEDCSSQETEWNKQDPMEDYMPK